MQRDGAGGEQAEPAAGRRGRASTFRAACEIATLNPNLSDSLARDTNGSRVASALADVADQGAARRSPCGIGAERPAIGRYHAAGTAPPAPAPQSHWARRATLRRSRTIALAVAEYGRCRACSRRRRPAAPTTAILRSPSGRPRSVHSVCPSGPRIAISLIGTVSNAACRMAADVVRLAGIHAARGQTVERARSPALTRDSASAIARLAEVSTSSWPCRSIRPPSQKLNAIKGAPASNTPATIAIIFLRVRPRATNPILMSGRATPSWCPDTASHGAVKGGLSLRRR